MAKKKYSLLDAYNYEKGNREASGANSTPKEPTKKTNYDNLSQAAGTRLTQMAMRESFGGSSFEKDYNDAMSAYNALASGWHDSDYISNTAKDLTAMRDRTEKYRTYQNIYGGMDDTVKAEFNKQMDNIGNQFEKTINNTGKYGELYSQFMNGRVYNKTKADMALAERYKDLTYDQVKAEREKYREGSPMYNFFNEYGVNIGYKDLKDYDKELADVGLPEESFFSKISAAPEDRKDGKANITGKNEKDKGTTYAKKLQAERNKYALDHTFDKYSDYLNAPDIDKYRTPQETENNSEGIKGRVIDSVKNIANGSTKYSSEHKLINTYFNGQSDVKFDTMHDDNLRNYEQMSSDEFAVYNKIYAEEGPEAAHKFLEDMKTILSKRATEKEQGKVSELLDKVGDTGERLGGSTGRTIASTVAGTAGTAVSLGLSLGSGLEAGADTALQMIQGKEVNPYGVYQRNQIAQENLTQKVSENIDKFTRENNIDTDLPLLHNVLPKIYEVGMSAATSYLGASAYGQSYENIMGLGAYASTMREMKEKGISQEDANVAAVIAGALEKITEDYSIENFLNIDNVDSVTAIGKAILSQMASEGQEEMASSIGNQVTDYLVNGGLSDYMHRVDEYMKQGYAEDRARNLSMHDAMMQVVEEGVAGAISGGMMGGPAAALNYSANKSLGNTVRQNNQIDDLFNTTKDVAESLDYNSDAIDYLRENRNGDGMEDAKIGVLYQKTLEDVNRIAGEGRTEEASSYEDRLYDYAKEKTAEERETIKKAKKIAKAEEGIVNSKTGEELKVNNVTKQNGETVVETDKGTMKLSEVAADDIHAKAIAYAENMNDEKSAVFMQTIEAGEVRNIDDFKTSFDLVYEKSFHNLGDEDILNISNTLTQKQALEIYKAVRANLGSRQNKRLQEIIKNHPGIAESKGKIDETAINRADLTSYQRNQMDITNHVYSMMGVNVVWLQSKADASGQFTEIRNGAFNIPSNTIYLDVNANRNSIMDMGNILSVASHEATHWLKLKSPVAYQELQKAVFDALAAGDSRSVEQMIAEEMRDTGVERDVAIEELVARACEDMLFNTDTVAESFAKMDAETKKTFVGRIKDAVKSVLDFFKEIRDSFKSDSNEAKTIQKNIDHLENVLAKFDAALKEGIENNRVGIFDNMTEEELNSLREISKTDSMTMAEVALKARGAIGADGQTLFNYKAMERDMPEYRKMLKEAGMSSKDIKNAFDTVDAVMEKVKEHLDILDYDYELDPDDRAFNPVKPNSDSLYKYSVDFSTLCRKRILQQIVQMELQSALNRAVTKEESIAIRNELMKIQTEGKDIEVACALCYVESARMKSPVQIQKFLDNRRSIINEYFANRDGGNTKTKKGKAELEARQRLSEQYAAEIASGDMVDPMSYTETASGNKRYASLKSLPQAVAKEIRDAKKAVTQKYVPTAEEARLLDIADNLTTSDFTSPEGLANLIKNHEDLFYAYTSFVRNATHSKGLEKDTWWRIGDSFKATDDLIAAMNKENGLRSQSWSDFQVIHTLDYIAAVVELSSRNAKMQAYTKVADYVKLMGNTNQMINLSLIPAAEYNGSLEYDGVEGMPFEKALELREKYPATAGTICIGIQDEQILELLASDLIDYVIPYHHSGMSKVVRKAMHIPTWKSYESAQGETKLDGKDAEQNAKRFGGKFLGEEDANYHKKPDFSDWFNLKEAQDIVKKFNNRDAKGLLTESEAKLKEKYGVMAGAYQAMQKMGDNYLKLCAERGLAPKFSYKDADFTSQDNYWKLLIDRKMINNKTGEIIEQKAVKPNFNKDDVLQILNDEVDRYQKIKADQDYATKTVIQKFISGAMKDEVRAIEKITGAVNKATDNVTVNNILNNSADTMFSTKDTKRDTEYTDDIRWSTRRIVDTQGKDYGIGVYLDSEALKGIEDKNLVKSKAKDKFKDFIGKTFYAKDAKGNSVAIKIENSSKKFTNHKGKRVSVNKDLLTKFDDTRTKNEVLVLVDETIETSKLINKATNKYTHGWVDNFGKNKWEYWRTYAVNEKGEIWELKLNVPITSEGYRLLYDVEIKNVGRSVKSVQTPRENILTQKNKKSQGPNLFSTSEQQQYSDPDLLAAENEQLKAVIDNILANTDRDAVVKLKDNSAFIHEVNKLLKANKSKLGLETAVQGVIDVYNAVNKANSTGTGTEEMFSKAQELAQKMLDKSDGRKIINKDKLELKRNIMQLHFSLTDEQIKEAKNKLGKETFAKNKRIFRNYDSTAKNIDAQWSDWASTFGEDLFPKDLNSMEMFEHLVSVFFAADKSSLVIEELNTAENVKSLSYDILDMWDRIDAIKKESDFKQSKEGYEQQIKELKQKHREEMQKLREANRQTVDDMKKRFDERYHERLADQLEKNKEVREQTKARIDKFRENVSKKDQIETITKRAKVLKDKLVQNSKDKHINTSIADPVARLLDAIDFSSKQKLRTGEETQNDIKLREAFRDVEQMAQKARDNALGYSVDEDFSAIDLAPEFLDYVQRLRTKLDAIADNHGSKSFVLNQMSVAELEDLNTMLSMLQSYATNVDKMLASTNNASVSALGQQFIVESKGIKRKNTNMATDFLDYRNALPYYFFKRLGTPGQHIFKELQDGMSQYAFNMRDIIDFAEGLESKDKFDDWRKEAKEFELTTTSVDGTRQKQSVKISVAQAMSLYCLSKREIAMQHLLGGGARFTDFTEGKKTVVGSSYGVTFSKSDIETIVNSLTAEQKATADSIVKFFATTCADWGNAITLKRFGIRSFGEENYFPVKSDPNVLSQDTPADKQTSVTRLLNMSFTKAVNPNANNRIVVDDIFTVLAAHSSDMALYNSFGLPVLDAFKWFNYKENMKQGNGKSMPTFSVKAAMENAYGKEAIRYINNLLDDINGNQMSGRGTDIYKTLISHYKTSAVGASMFVGFLQPTAYVRASLVLDSKYLVKGLTLHPFQASEEAKKYCGMALWKSYGNYDMNISRSMEDRITNHQTKKDSIIEKSMTLAEKGDSMTWGALWNACKYYVEDTHPTLQKGSEEYFKAAADKLTEIIYSSQVVDSVLTRTDLMRSKDALVQTSTAFMSEPAVSFNMLYDVVTQVDKDTRTLGDRKRAIHKNLKPLGKAFRAYAVTAAVSAFVEAFRDWTRDNDEDRDFEGWLKDFFENFKDDLNPLSKLPLIKDIESAINGFDPTRMDEAFLTTGVNGAKKTIKLAKKYAAGEDISGSIYSTAYTDLKALSQVTGLPMSNALRDVKSVINSWNSTIGTFYESLYIGESPSEKKARLEAEKKAKEEAKKKEKEAKKAAQKK